jgi:ribonuclease D
MNEIDSSKAPESAEYVYVREPAAIEPLVRRIGAAGKVALDTEADSLHNYFEKVCLIQLSLDGEHYVVDPLSGLELIGLSEALAGKPLILHGGDYDLRMLRAATGFRPRGAVFDTMIAAQILGIEQIGLGALVERYFDVAIAKGDQKSDWSRRPLSEKQLSYAINDTRFLAPLAEILADALNELGRLDWHEESCRAMVEAAGSDRARDPEEAWRIKGSGSSTARQLAYLRELWRWRDEHARRANRPPFHVFGNREMLDLVQWLDSHPAVPLREGPKLPRNIRGALLRALEEAIARVRRMDPAGWPERRTFERPDRLPAHVAHQINALRVECASIAKELGIAAATLAPKAALEAIARSRPRTVDEIMQSGDLLRWQAKLIDAAVEKCLRAPRR